MVTVEVSTCEYDTSRFMVSINEVPQEDSDKFIKEGFSSFRDKNQKPTQKNFRKFINRKKAVDVLLTALKKTYKDLKIKLIASL